MRPAEINKYTIEDLLIFETMATIDEFAHGEALINVLQTRKALARKMLSGGFVSEVEIQETQGAINYCNTMVCQVMGIPVNLMKLI